MPCRDIDGRVYVSVAGETAGSAPEPRLALTRLAVHVPARRAALARVRGAYFLDPAGSFLLQPGHHLAPSGGGDSPVKACLLADILARLLDGAVGRADHVPDLQVLDPDHVEPAREIGTQLLAPVLAGVRLAGLQLGYQPLHLAATVRALPGVGELALEANEPGLAAMTQARCGQRFARRQRRAHDHASVNADDLAVAGRRDCFGDGSKGNMPASGLVKRHPERLHVTGHRAGLPEPDPACLWDADLGGAAVQAAHVARLDGHDAESLVPAGLAPRRAAVRPGEERRHGFVVVADRLLLHDHAAPGQPRAIRPGLGQLAAAFREPGHLPASRTPLGLLLHAQVPHEPGMRAVLPQGGLLGRRGCQAVAGHTVTVS